MFVSDTCSKHVPSARGLHTNPSSPPNIIISYLYCLSDHLLFHISTNHPTLTFRSSSNSPYKTKSSEHKRPSNFHSLHPHFRFFHQCIYIHIKKLSILKHSLSSPFTLTKAKLLTYMLLILFSSLPPTAYIVRTCHRASLVTLFYAFSKFIKPTLLL